MNAENMDLWNKVCKTDPKYTKSFNRAGGFSGTAINATYLIRKATELWGPIGGAWGFEIEKSEFIPGSNNTIIHVILIKFRHPSGSFQSFGQTTFVSTNKNGVFTDEEAPKKSLTDALTKALSWLGFSADVHLGLFDDNKYVNDRKKEETTKLELPKSNSTNRIATAEISEEQKLRVTDVFKDMKEHLPDDPEEAWLVLENSGLDSDERVYLHNFFDSKERRLIKEAKEKMKNAV